MVISSTESETTISSAYKCNRKWGDCKYMYLDSIYM